MDNQLLINNSVLFIINMPGLLEKFVNMFRSALDEKYKNIMRPLPMLDAEQILKAASFFCIFLNSYFVFRKLVKMFCRWSLGGITAGLRISKTSGRRNFQNIKHSFQN